MDPRPGAELVDGSVVVRSSATEPKEQQKVKLSTISPNDRMYLLVSEISLQQSGAGDRRFPSFQDVFSSMRCCYQGGKPRDPSTSIHQEQEDQGAW